MFKTTTLLFLPLFFLSCSDDALVTIHNKKIADENIPCIHLVVFPPDENISKIIEPLYSFTNDCDFSLNISKKSGITCNSTHNIEKKALTNFPTSYLNMTLKKNGKLVYSYYIDLEKDVVKSDLERGFKRLERDLKL